MEQLRSYRGYFEGEGQGMTKEDAISRAEALKIVDELNDGSSECANIRAEIEKLPSIQSKVKTGHWTERKKHELTGFFLPTCSECGKIQPYTHHTFEWNFCPNCGAKMVEPQEGEDKE